MTAIQQVYQEMETLPNDYVVKVLAFIRAIKAKIDDETTSKAPFEEFPLLEGAAFDEHVHKLLKEAEESEIWLTEKEFWDADDLEAIQN